MKVADTVTKNFDEWLRMMLNNTPNIPNFSYGQLAALSAIFGQNISD